MKQEMMTIVRQQELAPRIYELVLTGELGKEMAMPGQFLHIRVQEATYYCVVRSVLINTTNLWEPARSFIVLKEMEPDIFLKCRPEIS